MSAKLWSMKATYEQGPDDNDPHEADQEIEISVDDGGAGKYFVIKTDRWAFDTVSEFVEMLESFKAKAGM